MIRRICSRYTLCYRFPESRAGSIRNIDVQLSPQPRERYPDARVVARGGYRLRPCDQYGFAAR